MGALGASVDRAAAGAQAGPLAVAVDEDPSLVEDAVEEQGRTIVDPVEVRYIDPAIGNGPQTSDEVHLRGSFVADG